MPQVDIGVDDTQWRSLWLYDVASAIVGGSEADRAGTASELDDGQLVAVRARDVVLLRRPPATDKRSCRAPSCRATAPRSTM